MKPTRAHTHQLALCSMPSQVCLALREANVHLLPQDVSPATFVIDVQTAVSQSQSSRTLEEEEVVSSRQG
jgi:hypothetical protein